MILSEVDIERLRQSGIVLDAQGRFWHEGQEVTHAKMRAAFFRWLDQNEDGRFVLRLDATRFVYLEVEDTPYVVASLRREGLHIFLRLSDDSDEELLYETVYLKNDIAYARVKKGRFVARFSSAAWNALSDCIEEENGTAVLRTPKGTHVLRSDALDRSRPV